MTFTGHLCQKLPETNKNILSFIIYVFFIQCICLLQASKLFSRLLADFNEDVYLLQAGKSLAIKHAQTEDVEQEVGVVVWPRLRCGPVSDGRRRKSVGMETDLSAPHYSHTVKKKKTSHPASRLRCSCSQFQTLARAAFV